MSFELLQGSDELSQGFRADPPRDQNVYAKTCSVSSLLLGSTPNNCLQLYKGTLEKIAKNQEKLHRVSDRCD